MRSDIVYQTLNILFSVVGLWGFSSTPFSQISPTIVVSTRLKGGGYHVPSNTRMCEWGQVQ